MKKRLGFLSIGFFLLTFTSCSYRVVRTGYSKQTSPISDCEVRFTKNDSVLTLGTQKGVIQLKDGGFTVSCSEEDALVLLNTEACSVDANVVLITNEQKPNFASSCYRCEAVFISLQMDENEKPIPEQNEVFVSDEKKKSGSALGAVLGGVLGFAAGYLLVSVLLGS